MSEISICHVLVCRILRAAGVFKKYGELTFNCTDFTIYDLKKLDIFEKNFERPK
jgi:hypothetical protein